MKRSLKVVILTLGLIFMLFSLFISLSNNFFEKPTGKMIYPDSCILRSAYWNVDSQNVSRGQLVELYVVGENCEGQTVAFEVKEKDGFLNPDDAVRISSKNAIFKSGAARGSWIAEWQSDIDRGQTNPPEYYFIAKVLGKQISIKSSQYHPNLLVVM
jgi:hypothetical protein